MPIYEYACEKCHEKQEFIQKFGEDAPEICLKCHAKGSLKKSVSNSTFHLKGGGWYKDLYASKKESPDSDPKKPLPKDSGVLGEGAGQKKADKKPNNDN
jgi:putative FmdB family regulatory protein